MVDHQRRPSHSVFDQCKLSKTDYSFGVHNSKRSVPCVVVVAYFLHVLLISFCIYIISFALEPVESS